MPSVKVWSFFVVNWLQLDFPHNKSAVIYSANVEFRKKFIGIHRPCHIARACPFLVACLAAFRDSCPAACPVAFPVGRRGSEVNKRLNFSLNSDSKKRKCMQHYTLNARLKINHHALLSIPDRFLARLSSTEINHNLWFMSMKNLPLVAVRQNRLIRQSWVVAVPSWSVVRVLLFSSHPPSFDSPRPFRVFQFEVTFRGRSIQLN